QNDNDYGDGSETEAKFHLGLRNLIVRNAAARIVSQTGVRQRRFRGISPDAPLFKPLRSRDCAAEPAQLQAAIHPLFVRLRVDQERCAPRKLHPKVHRERKLCLSEKAPSEQCQSRPPNPARPSQLYYAWLSARGP